MSIALTPYETGHNIPYCWLISAEHECQLTCPRQSRVSEDCKYMGADDVN